MKAATDHIKKVLDTLKGPNKNGVYEVGAADEMIDAYIEIATGSGLPT